MSGDAVDKAPRELRAEVMATLAEIHHHHHHHRHHHQGSRQGAACLVTASFSGARLN